MESDFLDKLQWCKVTKYKYFVTVLKYKSWEFVLLFIFFFLRIFTFTSLYLQRKNRTFYPLHLKFYTSLLATNWNCILNKWKTLKLLYSSRLSCFSSGERERESPMSRLSTRALLCSPSSSPPLWKRTRSRAYRRNQCLFIFFRLFSRICRYRESWYSPFSRRTWSCGVHAVLFTSSGMSVHEPGVVIAAANQKITMRKQYLPDVCPVHDAGEC